MNYKKILVAVDRSDESRKAFQQSVQIALNNDASLTIVHALTVASDHDYKLIETDSENTTKAQETAGKMLAQFKNEANEAGLKDVQIIIKSGSAKRIIVTDVIPNEQPDLVVVGATGMSALDRLFIGSVSEYIVRHSPVDVLVVRSYIVPYEE